MRWISVVYINFGRFVFRKLMLLKLDKWIIEIYGMRVNRFEVLVGNWFNGFIYLVNIY